MKTFVQLLEDCNLIEAKRSLTPVDGHQPVVSLLHHPIHGLHHKDGYGSHDIIRKKLKYKSDDHDFEHTAHAHMDKKGSTLLIGHHHPPKDPNLKKDYENKVKKHYSLPKGHGVKHYNIYTNKEF